MSSGRAAITVDFNILRANEDCAVEVESVDAQFPQCSLVAPVDPQQAQGDIGLPVGAGAGGAGVILVILIVIIIIAVVCCRLKKRTKRYKN